MDASVPPPSRTRPLRTTRKRLDERSAPFPLRVRSGTATWRPPWLRLRMSSRLAASGAVRSDVAGVGGARRPYAGTACARAIANSKNPTTRYVHRTGERRPAALDEFAALISGADTWQESPRLVSASVCAIGDNRGRCVLW
jgi:hypothetical protein